MLVKGYFCDVCGKQVGSGEDLKTISIGNGGDYTSYSAYNRYEIYKKYDLCVDCRKKIGIELPKDYKKPDVETIEQKLFNIVCEIVQMSLER